MSRAEIHHSFYLLGTVALAVAMPLSHFVMGLSAFLLLLNWVAEWNWREKWSRLKDNRQGILIAAFYLVYAIGLIRVTDWGAAGGEMLGKLPFLFAPLVVITSKPFSPKESQAIFTAFVLATLFGCVWNFIYAETHTLGDYREMSRFIDHIRFGLCVVMSVVFCIHFFLNMAQDRAIRYVYLIVSVIIVLYLIYSQTLSGILTLMAVAFCFITHLIANRTNRRTKWLLGGITATLLAAVVAYTGFITCDYFHVKDPLPDTSARTASGRPYTFEEEPMVESGHYIGHWVCDEELATAWAMRSDTAYDDLTAATLTRYLNSLGMRKDSAAVMRLSDEDIRRVEQKTANVHYVRGGSVRRALYETFFGLSLYRKCGVMDESSMLQRVELWRASWRVVRENWLFGVGIGNQRAALDRQLELQQSPIAGKKLGRGSHNQYLTFWLAAGIIPLLYFCFLLAYPFVRMRKRVTFVYFALILALALSMLVEDTLNAQTGRMMFTVFAPLLLFADTEKTKPQSNSTNAVSLCRP